MNDIRLAWMEEHDGQWSINMLIVFFSARPVSMAAMLSLSQWHSRLIWTFDSCMIWKMLPSEEVAVAIAVSYFCAQPLS